MCVPRDTSVLREIIVVDLELLGNCFKKTDPQLLVKNIILRAFYPFLASDDTRFIPFFAPLRGVPTTCLYNVFIFIHKQLSISRDSQSCDCIFGFHRKE